jgi:hypothetical protein
MLPTSGNNRCLALPSTAAVGPGPPPPFSTDSTSRCFQEAWEVYDTVNNLDDERRAIAGGLSTATSICVPSPTYATSLFGDVAFTDHTQDARGLPPRSFTSFRAAATEAAVSRLYGGIHFRSAIERGWPKAATSRNKYSPEHLQVRCGRDRPDCRGADRGHL